MLSVVVVNVVARKTFEIYRNHLKIYQYEKKKLDGELQIESKLSQVSSILREQVIAKEEIQPRLQQRQLPLTRLTTTIMQTKILDVVRFSLRLATFFLPLLLVTSSLPIACHISLPAQE